MQSCLRHFTLSMVDIKVCAVDKKWSRLKLVIHNENRIIRYTNPSLELFAMPTTDPRVDAYIEKSKDFDSERNLFTKR